MPPIEELQNPKNKFATEVYTADGKLLTTYYMDTDNRVSVEYEQLSPHLVKALLATEDVRFTKHSGIDFKVAPPGKVIKNLSLLSGGEQAFVAIALYFAILKVRPTPFCMLDEIDAALDDRNVERFASYLRNLSRKTQFIVITHRRGTMEASDVLYGVTMQEQGVSKLLRLDLNQMEEYLGIVE